MTTFLYNANTVKLVEEDVIDLEAGSDIHVFAVAVFEKLSDGKQFVVTNTNPIPESDNATKYNQHMSDVTEFINETLKEHKTLPVIMTGDFNTREQSEYYANLIVGTDIKDAKYEAETLVKDHSTAAEEFGKLPEAGNGNCIDHSFVNKRAGVKLFDVVTDYGIEKASDHVPVYADITFKEAEHTKVACIGDSEFYTQYISKN